MSGYLNGRLILSVTSNKIASQARETVELVWDDDRIQEKWSIWGMMDQPGVGPGIGFPRRWMR